MNIYLLSQTYNKNPKACKSAVIISYTEDFARKTNPITGTGILEVDTDPSNWVDATKYVSVTYLGQASARYLEPVTICMNFWE